MPPTFDKLEVVFVGAGERAHAWATAFVQFPSVRPVGVVARNPNSSAVDRLRIVLGEPGLPTFDALAAAMSAFPDAAIVAALPPKSSLDAAITIAAGDRIGLVEAPLAREAAQIDVLPRGAVDVLVAHGWADLPAAKSFARLRQRWKTAVVEVHGRPEKAGGEFDEVLVHALALVNVLLPDALVRSAKRVDSASFEGRFVDGQGATLELRTSTEGQSLSICVEVATGTIRHLWTPDSSSYEVPDFSDRIRTMEVPGAMQQFVSGLASLATGPHRHAAIRAERRAALRLLTHVRRRSREAPAHRIMGGDDLADAVKVMRLAHAVWCQLA